VRNILLLAGLVLALMGCAGTTSSATTAKAPIKETHQPFNLQVSEKIYVDSAFTAEETECIKAAAAIWNNGTNGVVHIDLVLGFSMRDARSNNEPYRYLNKIILRRTTSHSTVIKNIDKEINQELQENAPKGSPILQTSAQTLGYTDIHKKYTYVLIVVDRLLEANGLRATLDKQKMTAVVAHEVMHTLSIPHMEAGKVGILSGGDEEFLIQQTIGLRLRPLTVFTRDDAEAICDRFLCDPDTINYKH